MENIIEYGGVQKGEKNVIIRSENLMKTYGMDGSFVNALNRVNVRIYSRQFTMIVGASGSGKSTLLHMLGGIDVPSGGSVYVTIDDGNPVNIYALSKNRLAAFRGKNFGFVFQNYALLPVLTAWENVMLPSIYTGDRFDESYAERLFESLGLSGRMNHLPSEMSGGEQQRVGVIRALINRPKIIFADEPTGNLDRQNGRDLMELLCEIKEKENCTIVMVTHDPGNTAYADRVIHMRDGEIEEIT